MNLFPKLVAAVASLLGLHRTGSPTSSLMQKSRIKPFATSENDGIVHEFYHGISLEEFTSALPRRGLDFVEWDMSLQNYAIVLVSARIESGNQGTFTTQFSIAEGPVMVKTWAVATGNTGSIARALFLVPPSVISGITTVTSTHT